MKYVQMWSMYVALYNVSLPKYEKNMH